MMRIISWNIQWGRGADGRVDLARTARTLQAHGPADVICLQEVTRGFPALSAEPQDQVAALAAAFPGHEAIYAAGVDVRSDGEGRAQFGNLVLSALPVLQVFRHALPYPADPGVPGMPRCCLEVVVEGASGPLRILTTHLEYYSGLQRRAQVSALRALQAEAETHAGTHSVGKDSNPAFAARPRPAAALLCGDFNMEPGSDGYVLMTAAAAPWLDAWPLVHGRQPHAPTVGLHGADWPERAYCCDYFWVSGSLAGRLKELKVDAVTAASDHQPVVLEID